MLVGRKVYTSYTSHFLCFRLCAAKRAILAIMLCQINRMLMIKNQPVNPGAVCGADPSK
jgi:hypothetical protein